MFLNLFSFNHFQINWISPELVPKWFKMNKLRVDSRLLQNWFIFITLELNQFEWFLNKCLNWSWNYLRGIQYNNLWANFLPGKFSFASELFLFNKFRICFSVITMKLIQESIVNLFLNVMYGPNLENIEPS